MGIIDHIIFVVNCDLSEHESYDELQVLIGKVKEDLAIIKNDPEVYAYSALFSLFNANKEKLPLKDVQRLTQWEGDETIISFSSAPDKCSIACLNSVCVM